MKDMLKDMLNDIGGRDLFSGIVDILSKDPFTAYGTDVARIISSIYNAVMSVAMMLVFVYFLVALVDKMTNENFTWEQLWKQLAMFLAAKYLIEHGLEVMQLMSKVGVEMVSIIKRQGLSGFTGGLDANAIIANFEEGFSGIFKVIGHVILFGYIIFPWLLSWIMGMAVNVICYTRLIEIYIRACFAPIALSDFFKNGFQGGGWRYLKNFLAVCLQGAVLLAIAILFSTLLSAFLDGTDKTNLFQFLGIYLAVGCSAIMLMFRSLGFCKELMGVN